MDTSEHPFKGHYCISQHGLSFIADIKPCAVWNAEGMEDWTNEVEQALYTLDRLGVVVAISAGNDGKQNPCVLAESYTPNILAAKTNSPLIVVGAVNSKGQLARITSAGSAAVPITCYAMGKGIKIVDLAVEQETKQDGTTLSVAIVVGAKFLMHKTCPVCMQHSSMSANSVC